MLQGDIHELYDHGEVAFAQRYCVLAENLDCAFLPRFLVWSAESYGPIYWPRAGYLVPHMPGGLVAITIGPFQFWPRIRSQYPKVHRICGRIYLSSIFVGALGGMVMAATTPRNFAYASGLFGLAIAWLLTSGMAFIGSGRGFAGFLAWVLEGFCAQRFANSREVRVSSSDNGLAREGDGGPDRRGAPACGVPPHAASPPRKSVSAAPST
jgi:hypothetical protein